MGTMGVIVMVQVWCDWVPNTGVVAFAGKWDEAVRLVCTQPCRLNEVYRRR